MAGVGRGGARRGAGRPPGIIEKRPRQTSLIVLPPPIKKRLREWAEQTCRDEADQLHAEIMASGDLRLRAQWFQWRSSLFESGLKPGSAAQAEQADTAEKILARLRAEQLEIQAAEQRDGPTVDAVEIAPPAPATREPDPFSMPAEPEKRLDRPAGFDGGGSPKTRACRLGHGAECCEDPGTRADCPDEFAFQDHIQANRGKALQKILDR